MEDDDLYSVRSKFVPMTIDGSSHNGVVSLKRLIVGIILEVLLFVTWIVSMMLVRVLVLDVLIFLALLWIAFIVLRKVIWNERVMLNMYRYQKDNEVSTISNMWSIYNISDSGIISYCSGTVGVVVEIGNRSITCASSAELLNYMVARADLMRRIGNAGFGCVYLNRTTTEINTDNLDRLEKFSKDYSAPELVSHNRSQLKYNRKLISRHAKVEKELLLIYTPEFNRTKELYTFCTSVKDLLKGSVFSNHKVLNKGEVIRLFLDIVGVSFFDYSKAIEGVFVSESDTLDKKSKAAPRATANIVTKSLMKSLAVPFIEDDQNTYSDLNAVAKVFDAEYDEDELEIIKNMSGDE